MPGLLTNIVSVGFCEAMGVQISLGTGSERMNVARRQRLSEAWQFRVVLHIRRHVARVVQLENHSLSSASAVRPFCSKAYFVELFPIGKMLGRTTNKLIARATETQWNK